MSQPVDVARAAAQQVAARFPGVSLIVLFGSRARHDARPESDWDIAYAAAQPVDRLALRLALVDALGSERVDVVALDGASALLRYRAARDGAPLLEREAGAFARFWLDAVEFWCDVAPLVRAGSEEILAGLDS